MSQKIYVAMHKKIELPQLDDLYEPLLVGSYNKEKKLKITRDDEGENISKKNENYCELTGIYWIWKNSKDDIVGLCHYRRFLSKNKLFNVKPKNYLSKRDVLKDIENNIDIILPEKNYFPSKIISETSTAPNMNDMKIVENVIVELFPEYLQDYKEFIENNAAYLCNVMVTKKEIFNEYCEWLFTILFETEKRMGKETYINDPYRKRMFGFISERLLNVWINHHKSEYKIKTYPMINTEEKILDRIKKNIVQQKYKIKKILK